MLPVKDIQKKKKTVVIKSIKWQREFVRGPQKKEEIKLRTEKTKAFSHLFKSSVKHRKLILSIGERSEPRENARARVEEKWALPRPPCNVPRNLR